MSSHILIARLFALFSIGCTAACVPLGVPSTSPSIAKVKVSDPGNVSGAPIYIALDQGYFKAESLDIELVSLSPNEVVQSVATDQVQFGMTLPSPALFNTLARGVHVKIAAAAIVNQPSDRPAVFVVRRDLVDSGAFRSAADLRGATIAAAPDASQFYVERFLRTGGLTRADVQFVPLSEQSEVLAALAARSIDAAWLPEPFVTAAEKQGLATPVATTGELFPGAATQTLIMSPNVASARAEVATRFMRAYVRGLRTYYHALNKGDADRAAVLDALMNHTPIKDRDLFSAMGMPSMDPNGTVELASWNEFQSYFVERGLQERVLDLVPNVDTGPLNEALRSLGQEP